MAHYALIDSKNVVVDLFVGRDEDDLAEGVTDWEEYYATPGHYVRRYSYNTYAGVHYDPTTGEPSADQSKAFRKNCAVLGAVYDAERDAFILPQPFTSWTFDEDSCSWVAPFEQPVEYMPSGKTWVHEWNELSRDWDKMPLPYAIDSWTFDEATKAWSAPIPYPGDGDVYWWDEVEGSWFRPDERYGNAEPSA